MRKTTLKFVAGLISFGAGCIGIAIESHEWSEGWLNLWVFLAIAGVFLMFLAWDSLSENLRELESRLDSHEGPDSQSTGEAE